MIKETTLVLSPKQASTPSEFIDLVADELRVSKHRITHIDILKKALDARRKPVKYHFTFKVYIDLLPQKEAPQSFKYPQLSKNNVVHIIGCGPAGLFAALELIKNGIKPVFFERGKAVEERKHDIALLNRSHVLNVDSNYCFGEGGAGTYSDGKLYTRSKKKGDIHDVLKTFVEHGAAAEILYETHPHIGTDVLPRIITSIRKTLLENGAEFFFNSKLTDIEITDNCLKAIVINGNQHIPVKSLILAAGHSAKDVYRLLHKKNVHLEAKPFAVGVRVEHPQELINSIQYHGEKYDKYLPAANYKLVEQVNGRGVFSFCMCPGGIIVPSATEINQVVVNGMSNSMRNSPYANSGIVAQVFPSDFENEKKETPLFMLDFQHQLESKCAIDKKLTQTAPAQRLVDFSEGKMSDSLPANSYKPGVKSMPLDALIPAFLSNALKVAFKLFDKKMKGFYTNEAVVLGVESRTSSPVRITRNKHDFEHVEVKGLYPCGEGAGYAGGITSSAIDGINVAKAIAQKSST